MIFMNDDFNNFEFNSEGDSFEENEFPDDKNQYLDNELDAEQIDETSVFGNFSQTDQPITYNEHFGEIAGDPNEWAYYYQAQTLPDSCAIVAQQGILKTFGIDVTETELVNYAEQSGIYTPGNGTTMENVGDILDNFGVPTERFHNASIEDLINELDAGNRVIVGLDANEIWSPENSPDPFNYWRAELPDAGHAVWITGIDAENGVVYMNDSGIPDGQAKGIAIEDFANAWEDFSNFYCVTRV